MKTIVFVLAIVPLAYVLSVPTDSEAVWVKDVTPFQRNKRIFNDRDLPDQLRFQLRRRSNILTLNLKRNYMIDPNADVYFATKLEDGRSILEKTPNLGNIDVAYYQDRDNGASFAVRCVKRSSERCERVINGKIRMGDEIYHLRPLEINDVSENLSEAPYIPGRLYMLENPHEFRKDISGQDEDTANNEKNAKQRMTDLHQILQHARNEKRNNRRTIYNINLVVLVDSGIWDLFSSLQENPEYPNQDKVTGEIRQYFSYIMNGVHLTYQRIEDPSISLNIFLRDFVFFKRETDFPHKKSRVITRNGKSMVEADDYLDDLSAWDMKTGSVKLPPYDHAMLFTRYDIYEEATKDNVTGYSPIGGICEMGSKISVIKHRDYFRTVSTAAHELGHNLGASHDVEEDSIACSSSNFFIMSVKEIQFSPDKAYSRNPWLFSNRSVESFKTTLMSKNVGLDGHIHVKERSKTTKVEKTDCAKNAGGFYDETEMTMYLKTMPGLVYTSDQQCELIIGPRSTYCQASPEQICSFMKCRNPQSGRCFKTYYSAARGTSCGYKKWCIEGRCVVRSMKYVNSVVFNAHPIL